MADGIGIRLTVFSILIFVLIEMIFGIMEILVL